VAYRSVREPRVCPALPHRPERVRREHIDTMPSSDDTRSPREVDQVDFDPDYDPDAPIICEICGGEMVYTAACKISCKRCGYKRDCSDP
jgi:hypothetical protein